MTLSPESVAAIERTVANRREDKLATTFKLALVIFGFSLLVFALLGAGLFIYYGAQVQVLKRKAKTIEKVFLNMDRASSEFHPLLGNLTIPLELQTTPLAEKTGLVLGHKTISIRNMSAPYNPSMIEWEDGYLLFFRYDEIQQESPLGFYPFIGCCELDKNFEQTEKEFTIIDTGSRFSEDPRVVRVGEEVYLLFNDLRTDGDVTCRSMHVGKLNLEESKLEFSTDLDLLVKPIEKNWVPFEYIENGTPQLYLEYYLNPQKIMKLPNPKERDLVHFHFPQAAKIQKTFWPLLWGQPRGGATARIVDGQYMSFFHSFFTDHRECHWYVMGAYTFENKAPFRITSISHYPIIFEGIYNSPHMNTADPKKRVIFPGSLSEGIKDGKEVLYVCCGENDSSIKLITMDKQVLLKSLKKI